MGRCRRLLRVANPAYLNRLPFSAVPRVVGRSDSLLLGAEGRYGRDGAEDLLPQDIGVRRHVVEHGWLVEVAATVHSLSPDERLRSLSQGVLDQLGDLPALPLVNKRSYLDPLFCTTPNFHGT